MHWSFVRIIPQGILGDSYRLGLIKEDLKKIKIKNLVRLKKNADRPFLFLNEPFLIVFSLKAFNNQFQSFKKEETKKLTMKIIV